VSPHLRYRFQVMENVDNLRRVLVVVTEIFCTASIGTSDVNKQSLCDGGGKKTDFVHFKRNPSLSFGPMV